jgi:CheY-like chemotaxis protein
MVDGARDLRILVVDGDGPNRALLVEVLRGERWLVDGVATAEAARAQIAAVRYDLVVAEMTLAPPAGAADAADGLGGLVLAGEIPSLSKCLARPPSLVLVSASLRPSLAARAVEAGAAGFLTKPFRMFELLDQVRRVLSRRPVSNAPPSLPSARLRRLRQDAATALPSGVALRAVLRHALRARASASSVLSLVVVRIEIEDENGTADRLAWTALLGDLAAVLNKPGKPSASAANEVELLHGGDAGVPRPAARSAVYRIEDGELAFFAHTDLRPELGAIGTSLFQVFQDTRSNILPLWLACAVVPLPAPTVDSDRVLRFGRALLDRARKEGIGAVADEVPTIEGEKADSRFQLGSSRKPDLARRHRSSAPPRKPKS